MLLHAHKNHVFVLRNQGGFSMLELSLVMVVIGLLIGAILGGQELIKHANFKALIKEIQQYRMAIQNFKTQYDALPGDMVDATSYWTTTNGDGDGLIEVASNEHYKAWQHLMLAGLVSGSYNGTSEEAPSKIQGNSFYIYETAGSAIYNISGSSKNDQYIAPKIGGLWQNLISPIDAYAIDSKIDDGIASRGTMRAAYMPNSSTGTNCALTTGGTTAPYVSYTGIATYNLTQESVACVLYFYTN